MPKVACSGARDAAAPFGRSVRAVLGSPQPTRLRLPHASGRRSQMGRRWNLGDSRAERSERAANLRPRAAAVRARASFPPRSSPPRITTPSLERPQIRRPDADAGERSGMEQCNARALRRSVRAAARYVEAEVKAARNAKLNGKTSMTRRSKRWSGTVAAILGGLALMNCSSKDDPTPRPPGALEQPNPSGTTSGVATSDSYQLRFSLGHGATSMTSGSFQINAARRR